MDWNMWATLLATIYICVLKIEAVRPVRLNTITESLKEPGQKDLIYQRYQSKTKHGPSQIKPRVSDKAKIPINLREKFKNFKTQAKFRHGNAEADPKTRMMKLRERQIKEALKGKGHDLRTRINAKHFMSRSLAESGMPLPTLL